MELDIREARRTRNPTANTTFDTIVVPFLGSPVAVARAAVQYVQTGMVQTSMYTGLLTVAKNIIGMNSLDTTRWVEDPEDDIAAIEAALTEAAVKLSDLAASEGAADITAEMLLARTGLAGAARSLYHTCAQEALGRSRPADGTPDVDAKTFSTKAVATVGPTLAGETGLLEQALELDARYREAVESLASTACTGLERACAQVAVEFLYPGISTLIAEFCAKAQTAYICAMNDRGLLDFDKIRNTRMFDAESLASRADQADDAAGLLRQAFAACPFCPAVYRKCDELGLADEDTRQTAILFGCGRLLRDRGRDVASTFERATTSQTSLANLPLASVVTALACLPAFL